jgi:hypothetical protein
MKAVLGFVTVTAAEVAGLVGWLDLSLDGRAFAGLGALLAGEAVEWAFLAYLVVTSPASAPRREGRTARGLVLTGLTSLAEAVLWITWLALAQAEGAILATTLLFLTMHIKHEADVVVFTGRRFRVGLLSRSGLAATACEVGGAVAWLTLVTSGHQFVGTAVLAIAISVEHYLQFRTAGILPPALHALSAMLAHPVDRAGG